MSSFLSPVFGAGAQLLTNAGLPLAGGKIYTYLAGTTTLAATYIDNTQGVINANPIILDSSGRPPQEVWLQGGLTYKFVVTDSAGTPVGYTYDNVGGVNDATYPQQSTTEWFTGSTPTYASATSFTVPGNQTATYVAARRIKASVTAGTSYSSIASSSFAAGVTTVNVTNDSTPLDSGLSVAQYGIISPSPTSLPTTLVQSSTLQNQTVVSFTSGGTAAAFTLTPVPAATTTPAGQEWDVSFHTTNSAGPTMSINGLAALPLVKVTSTGAYMPLEAGDVVSGWRSKCVVLNGAAQILVRTTILGTTGSGVLVLSNSPALTGTPTAPTPTTGDSTTKLATTAFVTNTVFSPPNLPTSFRLARAQSYLTLWGGINSGNA